jgi:hypothetical protein
MMNLWPWKKVIEEESNNNTISFILDNKTDNIKVDFLFDNIDPDSAAKTGDFLYYLSGGYYTVHVLDILLDIAQKNPQHKDYIYNVINTWSLHLNPINSKINETEEPPIVKPSLFQQQAFNNNKTS